MIFQGTKIEKQTAAIEDLGLENVELKEQLRLATEMVNKVMDQDGSVLQRFHIKYQHLEIGEKLGQF